MRWARWSLVAAVAGTTLAPRAAAQPSLDLRYFRPPADPRGGIVLEPTSTIGPGSIAMGLYGVYSHRPIVLAEDGHVVAKPIEHQVSFDVLAGVGVGTRAAAWIRVPAIGFQSGDDLASVVPESEPLPSVALGDIGAGLKLRLLASERTRWGLAAVGEVTMPTGDERSFVGEGVPTAVVRGLAERSADGWALRGLVGPRLRTEADRYFGVKVGQELEWAVGAVLRPSALGIDVRRRWELHADVHGAIPIDSEPFGRYRAPALAAFAARCRLTDVSVLGGVEAPLDSALGVPRVRAVLAVAWAPRFYDADHDGVADDRDRCLDVSEDRDGFSDQDGCVDLDDDQDGVLDEHDACRRIPEDRDGFQDDDGCPDPDNDGDGTPDVEDYCPDRAGIDEELGCPVLDTDADGVSDDRDWCPARGEDRDGFQDDDGCPDLDNDGDGIPDAEDTCPDDPGTYRAGSGQHGCPGPDRDGDSFDDDQEPCPDAPEDFDNSDDTDGCPEIEAAPHDPALGPLVTVEPADADLLVKWRSPLRFARTGGETTLSPASVSAVRALAQLLNDRPEWTARVSVRPDGPGVAAAQRADANARFLATTLRDLCHRESASLAESWASVTQRPATDPGGVLVVLVRIPPKDQAP
ncbi:MAG: hypothetical protein JW751_22835 [Polyangiaceae bacterium]|nr:hypothetical protein [Polyangiaceae bacterium]